MIKRSFYESNAVVCVTPGMLSKVFPRCGATEGRWLKWLIFPMSQEYQWQDQSCLFTHHTGERALNCLERRRRSDVPSLQLNGAIAEIFPSCPVGKRTSAWWSEQTSLGQQLPNENFASPATAQGCKTLSTSSHHLSTLRYEDNCSNSGTLLADTIKKSSYHPRHVLKDFLRTIKT